MLASLKPVFLALSLIASLIACTPQEPSTALTDDRPDLASDVQITWDKWGVPHITAPDRNGALYAFGWAQMQSHAAIILQEYALSRGEGAKHLGIDHLESDIFVHSMDGPAVAAQWLASQNDGYDESLRAFVAGMNDYARKHPEAVPTPLKSVLPIRATDPLAQIYRVTHLKFVAGDVYRDLYARMSPGSNGIAVAPRKTRDGAALLLINPHLPWGDYFTLFEAHISTDEIDVYGSAMIGMPFISMGFTQTIGWTHTANMFDGFDAYALTLSGDGYVMDGKVKAFEERTLHLDVRQADGTHDVETVIVKSSAHGPVIDLNGETVAARLVGKATANATQQYWEMAAAQSLDAFEAAVSNLQTPFFNTLYADRNGDIFFLYGGTEPDRSEGDWLFWRQTVPGDRSDLIWTDILGYDALPKLTNPDSGFLQNTNDAPWWNTFPFQMNPANYSARIAPPLPPHYRAQRALSMLSAQDAWTFETFDTLRGDTHVEMASRYLPALFEAAANIEDPDTQTAIEVLRAWNGRTDADSIGAPLFIAWVQAMSDAGEDWSATPWTPEAPLTTPSGLADPGAALEALTTASNAMQTQFGSIDLAYGDVFRLRYGDADIPASVGNDDLGILRAGFFRPELDGTFSLIGGNSFVAIVEFGESVRARAILPHGNTSNIDSEHFGDQLTLFSEGELRDVYFGISDLKRACETSTCRIEQLPGYAGQN